MDTSAFGSAGERRKQIQCKAFERNALTSLYAAPTRAEPVEALSTSPVRVFKDPDFLDFLGLRQGHNKADLEAAILRQLEAFLLYLGRGFAFVERQKRVVIDGEDFYLDQHFYHRRLHHLMAIELKLSRFKAVRKGQIELYLKWLDKHARQAGEEVPVGLILCAESSREQVELLQVHTDSITVAEYWTELPSKVELERHLHQALIEARKRPARWGCCYGAKGMSEVSMKRSDDQPNQRVCLKLTVVQLPGVGHIPAFGVAAVSD
jgi:predicted nuclease of restriction endonuclease-like (RecB) superfamily